MSRRREEAELQRVLQLSTQQTRALAALPPVSLSSAPTNDSRDMELRPVHLSTDGTANSTPRHPHVSRSSYCLSPDPEGSDYSPPPPQSRVEVVVPTRSTRDSPDPLDSFDTSELFAYRDFRHSSPHLPPLPPLFDFDSLSGAPGVHHSPGPRSSANAISHQPSSGTEGSRRASARQQTIKDKKEADVAERKRKRAERKAQDAAAKAELEAAAAPSGDTAAEPTRPAPKRRTKKAKVASAGDDADSSAPAASRHRGPDDLAPRPNSSFTSNADVESEAPPRSTASSTRSHKTAAVLTEACSESDTHILAGTSSATGDVDSSRVEPELTSEHSSPKKKTDPVSPTRSPVGKNTSSPATIATTPMAPTRALAPANTTPRASSTTPKGGQWRTPRNDLAGVLAKFPGARRTGMSKRLNIVPLHATIGQGVKALPPPPPKNKKKVEEEEDDDEEDESGNPKIKVGSREWLMMED